MNNLFTILLLAQSFNPPNQQSVSNQSTINYAINADGTPIDLEPYFRHDPDAENRIQLRYDESTHSSSNRSHDPKKD
jgi:hypothetical protein